MGYPADNGLAPISKGVSAIVFLATEVLPGNAAYAVLSRNANPARLHALERQLHLNQGLPARYRRQSAWST